MQKRIVRQELKDIASSAPASLDRLCIDHVYPVDVTLRVPSKPPAQDLTPHETGPKLSEISAHIPELRKAPWHLIPR